MADIDDKIVELFNVLQKQKEEVKRMSKESKVAWKTKCSITIPEFFPTPINIQTSLEKMVLDIAAKLLEKQYFSQQAAKKLEIEVDAGVYDGFPVEDWFIDLKKRLTIISLLEKEKKLKTLEARLDAIVSPEQRRQMELDALTKEIAG